MGSGATSLRCLPRSVCPPRLPRASDFVDEPDTQTTLNPVWANLLAPAEKRHERVVKSRKARCPPPRDTGSPLFRPTHSFTLFHAPASSALLKFIWHFNFSLELKRQTIVSPNETWLTFIFAGRLRVYHDTSGHSNHLRRQRQQRLFGGRRPSNYGSNQQRLRRRARSRRDVLLLRYGQP